MTNSLHYYHLSLIEDQTAGSSFEILFECSAENVPHAIEQANNAYPLCLITSCEAIENAATALVLYSPSETEATDEGVGMFWSNTFGWASLESATRFAHAETHLHNMPISKGNDAKYIPWEEADTYYGSKHKASFRLVFEVKCSLNEAYSGLIKENLLAIGLKAIEDGLVTGASSAEIDDYSMKVDVVSTPPSEEVLAHFMTQRLAAGDIDVDDIPMQLARYGLMSQQDFINEMRERMRAITTN